MDTRIADRNHVMQQHRHPHRQQSDNEYDRVNRAGALGYRAELRIETWFSSDLMQIPR